MSPTPSEKNASHKRLKLQFNDNAPSAKRNSIQELPQIIHNKSENKAVIFTNAEEPTTSFQQRLITLGTPLYLTNPTSIQQHLMETRGRDETKSVIFNNEKEPIHSFQKILNTFGASPQITNPTSLQQHSMRGRNRRFYVRHGGEGSGRGPGRGPYLFQG